MWTFLKSVFKKTPASDPPKESKTKSSAPARPQPPLRDPTELAIEKWVARLRSAANSDCGGEAVLAELRDAPEQGRVLERFFSDTTLAETSLAFRFRASLLLLDRGDLSLAETVASGLDIEGAHRLRADIRERAGDFVGALAEVERGLARSYKDGSLRDARERLLNRLGRAARPKATATAGETLAVGQTRASFELRAPVGRGGSATVYEAFDPNLGRAVALKAYHRAAEDTSVLFHEARVSASMAGPGVIAVYDVVPEQGLLILEWASRGSLKDVFTERDRHRELWPIEGWLTPLVNTLSRVHRAGWVHGDFKPSNVLFGEEGPLLADFGLAARFGEPHAGGTRGYRSPERERGAHASPSDDVYALGVVLGEALAFVSGGSGTRLGEVDPIDRFRELARAWIAPSRPVDASKIVLASH